MVDHPLIVVGSIPNGGPNELIFVPVYRMVHIPKINAVNPRE